MPIAPKFHRHAGLDKPAPYLDVGSSINALDSGLRRSDHARTIVNDCETMNKPGGSNQLGERHEDIPNAAAQYRQELKKL
jgi:hypothetical protein